LDRGILTGQLNPFQNFKPSWSNFLKFYAMASLRRLLLQEKHTTVQHNTDDDEPGCVVSREREREETSVKESSEM